MTNEHIIRNLEHTVNRAKTEIDEWADKVKENPLYHLSWGNEIYLEAAKLKVGQEALAFLKAEVNPDFEGDRIAVIREEWTQDVLRLASRIPSSTSQSSNMAENAERAAKAVLLRDFFSVR